MLILFFWCCFCFFLLFCFFYKLIFVGVVSVDARSFMDGLACLNGCIYTIKNISPGPSTPVNVDYI